MLRLSVRKACHLFLSEASVSNAFYKERSIAAVNPNFEVARAHFSGEIMTRRLGRNLNANLPFDFRFRSTRSISVSRQAGEVGGSGESGAAPTSKSGFLAWYLRKLDEHPLVTKSLTAGCVYLFSDLTAQAISAATVHEGEQTVEWDKIRTLRMLGVGLFMSGPLLHVWFNLMAKAFPKNDVLSILKKMFLGQALFAPCFTATFFSVNALAQGESGEKITHRLQRDLLPTLQHGLMYWPFMDFITFRFFPVHLQVLFNNCCSFFWTIYLTHMAGKKAAASKSRAS